MSKVIDWLLINDMLHKGQTSGVNEMENQHITVVYKWTANPGKLDELSAIYAKVTQAMEQNEPGAEAVHCYVSEKENALYVRDEFKDAQAMGFHLQTTAAGHFPQLMSIATPGPFFFLGDVPQELQAATEQMQLGAEFGLHTSGFNR
jgi:quinol monooxygenase YgiN